MSCFPKSNPLPAFPFHLGKEMEVDVDQLKNLKYKGQKHQ